MYPSFVYQLALNHLSLFLKSSRCPLLPFYFPEYCKSSLCDINLSIWHTIFAAFDVLHAKSTLAFSDLPLETLLDLLLYELIILPDSNHWTLKHKTFLGGQFFIFDTVQQRLRLRVVGEYTHHPRLCQQLYTDILQNCLVKLQSTMWPHILEVRPPSSAWSDHSMVTTIFESSVWKYYTSQTFKKDIQTSSLLYYTSFGLFTGNTEMIIYLPILYLLSI